MARFQQKPRPAELRNRASTPPFPVIFRSVAKNYGATGLIWDLLLASSALLVCAVCFLRITMIRRVKKVRLADHFKYQ
jgi:hypothetical protein